jgi:AraC family transcriptional regulator of adaptative response/methylated-DNA-[protein]-cysteine methyltransferase
MAIRVLERNELPIIDQEACWQVALSKDTSMDGVFYVAVRTTRVYCRPSCPARPPKRENVSFYLSADECEAAGYRACKRCKPREITADGRPELMRQACDYLESEPEADASLAPVAKRMGVGAEYLRRLFRRTLGVTPREYSASRRALRLKQGLRQGATVTQALYDAGYPSSNRLYEAVGTQLGMTPSTYRKGGRGMVITYQVVDSVLGKLLVGATDRGVCSVQLGASEGQLEGSLRREFPEALLMRHPEAPLPWVQEVVAFLDGRQVRLDMPVDIQATAFQIKVWRALREIAYGQTKSYSQVARDIGMPTAARAVARACATNPVPLIVPCHRVVRNNGELGGYAMGVERKEALLEMESEHAPERQRLAETG